MNDARAIADQTARASYGRLLAWLASRRGDVAEAEDALSEAFKSALEHWPVSGIPDKPEAWLLTAARRKIIDAARRQQTRRDSEPSLILAADEAEAAGRDATDFPDERLKLLFVCAHPAIDAAARTPLMLQTVLGLDAERIASAFLVTPATMSQRLVRAKRKIRDAQIPFQLPQSDTLTARLDAVLTAIYAAFNAGYDEAMAHSDYGESSPDGFSSEAIYLARLIATMMPASGEVEGLLALMLYVDARQDARLVDGEYVPLSKQDIARWDRKMIMEAEAVLARAWAKGDVGRYQIEAAIQSAHFAAALHDRDTSADIVILYERLIDINPTIGATVAYAAALSQSGRANDGIAVLDGLDRKKCDRYQSYWAVRAHLLVQADRLTDAIDAYRRAIGLSENPATRRFLRDREKSAHALIAKA